MTEETKVYTLESINEMLLALIPQKGKTKSYFSLINKWVNIEGYTLPYVYFVVKSLFERYLKSGINIAVGYVQNSMKTMVDKFDPEFHKVPYCATREELLKIGHTVDTLPYNLLTKDEKKERKADKPVECTDEERNDLKEFLEKL